MLQGPLALVLCGFGFLHLECWMLSYLAWPWSPDHDVFATLARSWDAGMLPYRDMEANNLPATIYVYWVLGKVFGWGRTMPFFALDATLVVLLGIVMLAWSWRRFETALPAAVGWLWFLRYYLGLDYSMAGERDWHASLLAVLAMMTAESWPGRRGLRASAVIAALAVAVRPQALLFLPAFALIVDAGSPQSGTFRARAIRMGLDWGVTFAATLALTFVPLLLAGIADDFVHDFRRAAYGGLHNPLTAWNFLERSLTILCRWEVLAIIGPAAILTAQAKPSSRRSGGAWIAALLVAVLYKAVSPRQHDYLDIPRFLLLALNLSAVVGMIIEVRTAPAALHLAVVLMALGIPAPVPRDSQQHHADMQWSFATFEELRHGAEPFTYPNGYAGDYSLQNYLALLDHLNETTGPETSLANALAYPLALTGPTARLSAFPAESLAWLMYVRSDDEDAFIDKLERTSDSVVVWVPSEFEHGQLARFGHLEMTIRNLYEFDTGIGPFEIWRRVPQEDRK